MNSLLGLFPKCCKHNDEKRQLEWPIHAIYVHHFPLLLLPHHERLSSRLVHVFMLNSRFFCWDPIFLCWLFTLELKCGRRQTPVCSVNVAFVLLPLLARVNVIFKMPIKHVLCRFPSFSLQLLTAQLPVFQKNCTLCACVFLRVAELQRFAKRRS